MIRNSPRLRAAVNSVTGFFGWKLVESRIGFWRVRDGHLQRNSYLTGYRWAKRDEWLPEGATELDRFAKKHCGSEADTIIDLLRQVERK